ALARPELAEADVVLLAAGLQAIPTERRPNPVPGKDAEIEMEPLTPRGEEPVSFAVGRLFHEDPAMVLVQLARQHQMQHEARSGRPRKALVVSNPGNSLPLLETFSRHTAKELANRGFQTTALFSNDVSAERMRAAMAGQDFVLWEGHYKTLIDHYQ